MNRMTGKVAAVTGAGAGIGRAIAVMFAAEGARVVCADINPESNAETARKITEAGGEAVAVTTDVTRRADLTRLLAATQLYYGGVTTLVNCAGVLVHAPFLEHTDADLERVFETNFRGYYWAMQAFLPVLAAHGHSSVLNIASISALKPESDAYVYGAMKAAVNKMTRDLTREFSPQGVRLNVICPGPVQTNLTPAFVRESEEIQREIIRTTCPVGRLGEPNDIAYAAVWLCSDEADWVTGSTVVIDGGACNMG
ncbi:MAG: SDR family oxidoreductase [Oscillospiraceae bacterium]|jgi:NAD(P)-dependent dehydrogenase (short-subunit alcohol dehydrogenase family)|nr:SDR family oxidoreductase [Oscillospiraceae bacterium]